MTAEEYLKEYYDGYIAGDYTLGEVIGIMQSFARLKCKERREKDKQFILPLCKKLITKVDTGKARSKETYKDMKDIINFLNSPEPEI